MEMRSLGTSGLQVSRIGLGLAALGRPGYINIGHDQDVGEDRSQAGLLRRTHDLLDAAFRHGIRYVDAARSYGRAEDFLSTWLAARPDVAPAVTVGSKWGYTYTADWQVDAEEHEVKDHSLATFARQYDETVARLGGHLDLYQIHSATLDSGVLEDREVLAALARLSTRGTVVGLTLSGPEQSATLRRALEVEVDGVRPFRTVQATWNVLEPSVGPMLAEAHQAGWGVIIKEAVANGRLTDRGSPPPSLVASARRLGVGADAVAIAAALAQPFTDVVLSGAATREQLRANVAAIDLDLEDDLDALDALAEPPEEYWSQRSALPWT